MKADGAHVNHIKGCSKFSFNLFNNSRSLNSYDCNIIDKCADDLTFNARFYNKNAMIGINSM